MTKLEGPCFTRAVIRTRRLSLRLPTEAFFQACLNGQHMEAERLIGASLSPAWFEEMGLLARRVERLREHPDYATWGPRVIVLEGERRAIGHIGFHGTPNEPYLLERVPDGIEFGYTVDEAHRRQGYAFEASLALMRHAARHGVSRFIVSVSPGNAASQGLAAKLGFRKIGEHVDEVDGLEEVLELTGEGLQRWLVDEA